MRGCQFKGVLVIGEGNKLTATQRSDVEQLLKSRGARNAVVTSSAVTRGVMTTLGWLGLPVKAFAPDDLTGAFDFLKVPPEHRGETLAAVEGLQRALRDQREQGRAGAN